MLPNAVLYSQTVRNVIVLPVHISAPAATPANGDFRFNRSCGICKMNKTAAKLILTIIMDIHHHSVTLFIV